MLSVSRKKVITPPRDLKTFPTTRYQGSKRKILPWIYEVVNSLSFKTVLDVFGGTASVSYLFKRMDKIVTYNDSLRFNYLIGKAIIENDSVLLEKVDIDDLLTKLNSDQNSRFIQNHFKGQYFLDNENKWLDQVTSNIVQMNHYSEDILDYKKDLAFYALFQACLIKRPFNLFHRKNLSLRTRDVERSFRNKIQWDKSFEVHFKRFVNEVNSLVFNSGMKCRSLQMNALELQDNEYDLVYLDPPYFRKDSRNETSNYLKCYHFLEGLANFPDWISDQKFHEQYLSSDINKKNIREVLENLCVNFRNSTLLISYKAYGEPSISWICSVLRKLGKSVHTRSKHYAYALNHQNGDAIKNREVLIIGTD
ncbi:MAG: DNA adenine methylase [Bacteroidota bacterium]|jgi:adenine-specific DNA-methyltransferase